MNICLSCEGVTATAAQRCGHCGAFLLPLDSVHYPLRRGEAEAGNPLLGSVVANKYRLEGVLGRGGLGTVFQAEHVGSLMKVAVKLLHPRYSERSEYRRALLPEARRAATVTNERCARLLDVGETTDGGTYLAMELVDGDTLDTLIRGGALSPSHAVDILVQIAEALVAIHAAGLVHCDLAPRNVMVATRNGQLVAKVLDFGIARSVSMTAGERLDGGEFVGFANPAFSAPEHLAGSEVDPRADLYSLGALAWFLLTGKAPIDSRDASRAARAAVAGQRDSWPGVAGVPRRLQRLIERCLSVDPDQRPPVAATVLRELLVIRGARRPALARVALAALALAVVFVVAAFYEATPPFLHSVAGSGLTLHERQPSQTEYLPSSRLDPLLLRFGGFPADQLRLDVSQAGTMLLQAPLKPVVKVAGDDMLTLSVAQPEWESALKSLRDSSRKGALDVSFVVPGRAPLGMARIRLDDEPPQLTAGLEGPAGETLTSETRFRWQVSDAIGLNEQDVAAFVVLAEHGEFVMPLAGNGGILEIGRALQSKIDEVGSIAGGTIRVEAADLAGNRSRVDVAEFARCDVHAPRVVAVTGPAGEAFVPSSGGVARLRVQLSDAEPDCVLEIRDLERRKYSSQPIGTGTLHDIEIASPGGSPQFVSNLYEFEVRDAVGNRAAQQFTCTVRDRSARLQFLGDHSSFTTLGDTLVIGPRGAKVTLRCSEAFAVTAVTAASAQGALAESPIACEEVSASAYRVTFPAMPAGSYRLEVELEGRETVGSQPVREVVRLRVLPAEVEVRVNKQLSRFLPGLVQAGVLEPSGAGYREGNGWAIDKALAPFVRGTLWVGFGLETLMPLTMSAPSSPAGALLPEFLPFVGHNVLAVSMRDVLDRPVRVLVGDQVAPRRRAHDDTMVDVIAEFYWNTEPPKLIGEELMVEFDQAVRLGLRFFLPYEDAERNELILNIAQSEIKASSVVREGELSAVATFELPFKTWSVAAQLADEPRESFAKELLRTVPVNVQTPVGSDKLSLTFHTTRSTLRPVRLAEFADVPAPLSALQLVPVLGPDGPFAEPVPNNAPPRALFRPQVAVEVRNIADFLLQDRELTCGEARALVEAGLRRRDELKLEARLLVHADDPLGAERLRPESLLPASAGAAAATLPLTGVDYYQAYTCCRLLGVVFAGDPTLFRLPVGCELELAAFGAGPPTACNGPAAAGKPVSMDVFEAAAERLARGQVATADETWIAGDFVTTPAGDEIGGLDFGVREWVGDLPYIEENVYLLNEWIADHQSHLTHIEQFANGSVTPPRDLAAPLQTYGVVRGLALGERDGLLLASGQRLDPASTDVVPGSVPGVLRSEQLRRDGRDLLSTQPDPRLRYIGFRVAGTAALIARLRGQD